MTIGSELDKQIYPEGESTWGCKSGVLDVEDVRGFIKKQLCSVCQKFPENNCSKCNKIKEDAGEKLI